MRCWLSVWDWCLDRGDSSDNFDCSTSSNLLGLNPLGLPIFRFETQRIEITIFFTSRRPDDPALRPKLSSKGRFLAVLLVVFVFCDILL